MSSTTGGGVMDEAVPADAHPDELADAADASGYGDSGAIVSPRGVAGIGVTGPLLECQPPSMARTERADGDTAVGESGPRSARVIGGDAGKCGSSAAAGPVGVETGRRITRSSAAGAARAARCRQQMVD